ncbi:MAG: hydantoinase/oxoprolinase family protein [Desulfitobacteriaceae bacterium]|nr:hydantoinase/oxoprolinase family protein [Desulfitobacteriaceae bacterium]MDD4752357.1 hydantoinase/oxoprolinase family protein [Desulfitobacteriaceae bacterium]
MSLVLGIDTGGTYTDGAVVDLTKKKIIAKAKALTTREDLTIGIRDCINNLKFNKFNQVGAVSLSTTLATNSIVEGRGCIVGLVLIGHDPLGTLPTEHFGVISGGHDIKGFAQEDLDIVEACRVLERFRGVVDAVAVSGYLSVRNPDHELKIKDLVRETLHLPVVCAHQLTTTLGFHERTVTAVLNARLMPIIEELMVSVKKVLNEREIDAPVMIVKGDGSLMSETLAKEKPIDTILSGPASSIIGSTFLTGMSEALVLDMGGTTTDIAVLEKGVPRLNLEGAMVGRWLTRVEAAEIYTFGLGGDSYLQVNREGKLKVGPQRVWPLAVTAFSHPHLVRELKSYLIKDYTLMFAQPTDCFFLLKEPGKGELSNLEKGLINELRQGPHSLFYLAEKLDLDPILFNLQHLINQGIVAKVSFTPTDVLHAKGVYTQWNVEAAQLGAKILAEIAGKSVEEFLDDAQERIEAQLCLAVVESLINREGHSFAFQDSTAAMYFVNKAILQKEKSNLNCMLKVEVPIVAIGAPVRSWLPPAAQRLHTELVIPEHAEVANAVGAAAGKIMETVRVLIKPGDDHSGYLVHGPNELKAFSEIEDAEEYGLNEAKKQAAAMAEKAGSKNFELLVNRETVYTRLLNFNEQMFIECRIEVTAVGRPDWEKK